MNQTSFIMICGLLTVSLVGAAVVTDLRWRRIPNVLTFPAFAAALIVRAVFQGWVGLGFGLAGALVAPALLLLLRGGHRIGMGDLKFAIAIGAIVGPLLAVATMLASTVAGGVLALCMMLGEPLRQLLDTLLIGLPFSKKKHMRKPPATAETPATSTVPYGVAIGAGSLLTLGLIWWTGNENWLFSFAGIAARQ